MNKKIGTPELKMKKLAASCRTINTLMIAALGMSVAHGANAQDASGKAVEEVVVTGSILKRSEISTASPVTVLSAEQLDLRGVNTISDAVTLLPANNAGSMPTSWSSFGFATGASAVSLRGLTTSSSLTVFDGLRMSPYPLGDDGRRNFVDLGAIPDSIVDRVEVLKDGASSTYGADAIAGVVNVITKKEITGLHFNGSGGTSQEGDGNEYRGDVTWGTGELASDGFNFYMNVEVQQSDSISSLSRGFPFNTHDWTSICNGNGGCLDNGNINGLQPGGILNGVSSTGTPVPMMRPYDMPGGSAMGNWQLANPGAGCGDLKTVNPTNAADVNLTGPTCEFNYYSQYVNVYPSSS